MTPVRGKIVANKYRLEHQLAEGGMGEVWVARHLELDVEVAVKFISNLEDEGAETARLRFKREAMAAARLKSPHVTQIHDYGVEEGAPYIAMELLEGEDLDGLLTRQGRIPLRRCADLIEQVCRGLKLAHDAGIVHRDLKPSNIFLARIGEDEVVKILDFGIAKEMGARLVPSDRTRSGVVMGSPRYMSPEQTQGDQLDYRTDLWAVAVIAFEAVTGASPFDHEYIGQIINSVCNLPLPVATEVAGDLPPDMDRFFARGLARPPEQRFTSARELAEAFVAVVEGRPLPTSLPTIEAEQPRPPTPPRPIDALGPTAPSTQRADRTLRSVDATSAARGGKRVDEGRTTAARVINVVSAPDGTQRLRARKLRTWLPIAIGVTIATVGWLVGRGSFNAGPAAPATSAASSAPPTPSAPPAPAASTVSTAPAPSAGPSAAVSATGSAGAPEALPSARRPPKSPPPAPSVAPPRPPPRPTGTATKDSEFGI
ncbi:MAG: serine/threonine protein kinase [Deltaproteobacteria bacterium]|nr:serine/threonine protein kinase [Deltaproteobacteria bacterium]